MRGINPNQRAEWPLGIYRILAKVNERSVVAEPGDASACGKLSAPALPVLGGFAAPLRLYS
jgi:hypothetical protein